MPYTIAALEAELPSAEMNDLVTEILASGLRSIGLFSGGARTIGDLSLERKPAAYYERWLSSSIDYLRQQTFLADDLTFIRHVRPLADVWSDWKAKRSGFVTGPNQQAQTALLEACVEALPDILTGRRRATDVMFPNSSMHLVEGLYRGNPQANYFNDVLGETLSTCIDRMLETDPERKIRILEIGAGTGGTTATLLPLLQHRPVEEYCYTDLSKAFLMHAEKNFQPQFSALRTTLFDVSRPLESQSIAPNHYDFAIAANVLHATSNIRETLRNAKAALKNQGVLLLNEIGAWSLFNHLTFGLLEGWWLYEDSPVRLAGSPGLSPEKWREILAEEGFESIAFPAEEAHKLGQQIVVAVSDGWTRQRIVVKPARAERAAAEPASVEPPKAAVPLPETRKPGAPAPTEQMSYDYTRQIITAKLSEALKMDAGMIRDDASFADYGVDSIVGVNLLRVISEALQIELETTSLFEYSTVEQLTHHVLTNWPERIAAQLSGQQPAAATAEEPAPVAAAAEPQFVLTNRFDGAASAFADADAISTEPIAIIGMSGRFAESETLEAFWRNLAEGKDLVKPVSRWRPSECVMPGSAKDGYCSRGSFIDSIDQFDPAFFGISAEEAAYMDPQQRLFLGESWRALEDAGYGGKGVHETQCGVYVGCGSSNYDKLSGNNTPPQAFWGNSQAVTPARIAYCLNLQGPAMAIDTACSSSLVAIHLACQGLWSRETEMAVAGGVFLQPTPGFYQVANRAGMLSRDGKCYSFDARANGFVPGEGVGVVVLKRLRDALADGDSIHGVIAGSGINQDGKSNGLTAPNGRAQERLERTLYERFGINPETIQVLEAHGTGTLLGDSVEYGAITRAFREQTDKKQFCALGTLKTNIGHTSTASGVAGVIKLLLSLRHRQIAPSIHFEKSNPAIDLESGPFYINTSLREWAVEAGQTRRAAVSSFGFSGTNAHLILEEAPVLDRTSSSAPAYLAMLSARTAEQLAQQARNLLAHLESTPGFSMTDLTFSLFAGRTHFDHRLACVARNENELIRSLQQWLESGSASQVRSGEIEETRRRDQVSLKKFGNYCIRECQEASNAASYAENLVAVAELYVQGVALDYTALFPADARRIPLPTYPFARERYWVEAAPRRSPSMRTVVTRPARRATVPAARPVAQSASFDGDLRGALQNDLSRMVVEILAIDARDVAADKVLMDLGLDSIGLTNFAGAINQRFQLDITPVLFFDYPSLGEIARYLASERESQIRAVYGQPAAAPVAREPLEMLAPPVIEQVAAERSFGAEPMAIVGIAGVMPQSEDLDALWANLQSARDLVTVIPRDRWDWEDYYGDPLAEVNKSNSRWGGFMKEVDKFDPLFFGISPREAQMMDPQQRIFLETVWKAIEDSGQKVSDLSGTRTGLFVGVGSNDYIDVLRNQADVLDGYTASGNSHSVLANRVSFLLNLRGPSAPIDTACSSSLVALHRAIESLQTGSCDMAIVGGVQVILSPGAYISFGTAGMLSSDGKCKTFDKKANGYVRGEGCGAMLLKPLSMAEADGNHIYAVILATSENHGGRVTTMTAPNSSAQAALLVDAYEKAQIDPTTVGYIECHGTGTSLGDPIEVQALSKAFAELYRANDQAPAATPHCGLGTVKTNVGHLETAAGIAGVLKVLLAMKHKQLPATLHFEELNPFISLEGTPFYVVDKLTPWDAAVDQDGAPLPRRAGVSSFGFGGANAHAVLEEYIAPARETRSDGPQLIVLSAKNEERLAVYAQSLREYLERSDAELADLAHTLQVGRDEMPARLAVVASSAEELKRTLDEILGGRMAQGSWRGSVAAEAKCDAAVEIERLIEQKELGKLAELWVSGAKIDWRLLRDEHQPRRISAPTYPFARERYWVPGENAERGGIKAIRREETESALQSFVPSWNPARVDGVAENVSIETNVLLLGSDRWHLDWVRRSCPNAELVAMDAVETIGAFDQLLWIAPDVDAERSDGVVEQQEEGVLALFRAVKALLRLGYGEKSLQWTIVTGRTQPVREDEELRPAHAGVAGLIGSLAKEYPRWDLRMLDVESLASVTAAECFALPYDKQGNALAHRGGRWFEQGRKTVEPMPAATAPLHRRNGVYVVIGGAGGIGEVWSRFMIERYGAKVVWIGRRPCDAAIEQKIAALGRLGEAPLYIAADATNVASLDEARRAVLQRHGAIHGVVHSALVLRDQSLARMDEAAFRASLAAKIDVAVNIDRVFGGDALDFVLFFSSIASFLKPAGQSNYAAGCTFKDSFAWMLEKQRRCAVKVINWGYWGGVGAAADDAHRQNMARLGLGSIEPQEGMAALEALMGSDLRQMALVKTLTIRSKSAPGQLPATQSAAAAADPQNAAAHVRQVIAGALADELRIDAAIIRHDVSLQDYGVDSIIGVNVVRRISEALQVPLEASSLFEYGTADRLAGFILGSWQAQIAAQMPRAAELRQSSLSAPGVVAPAARIHPLLHVNTSTLGQQSYRATLAGAELFLEDHQLGMNGHGRQKVLPEAAYLEMARAAIESAAGIAHGTAVVEIEETVWGPPMIVGDHREVTIALLPGDDDQIHYEIHSGDEAVVHCQGCVTISSAPAPAPLDAEALQRQMNRGSVDAESVYATFGKMGLHYGPAHQAITALHQGHDQLLARLSLPSAAAAGEGWDGAYVLHPILMTGALQAGMHLAADAAPRRPSAVLTHALRQLRVLSPCRGATLAWARLAPDARQADDTTVVDVDLLDAEGYVCAQLRGLSIHVEHSAMEHEPRTWLFSTGQHFIAGGDTAETVPMGVEKAAELFLKQEAALQLDKPLEDIGAERSYFDLGFSAPSITNFVQAINRLLQEDLSPSILFDHRDIRSLAAYLAVAYPKKIGGLTAIPYGHAVWPARRRPSLAPLPRKTYFTGRLAQPSAIGEQLLDEILWQEASFDDSYEKVTF
jgi:acyl transferase domain-containing protein/SAM-dependent methyltransferase